MRCRVEVSDDGWLPKTGQVALRPQFAVKVMKLVQ